MVQNQTSSCKLEGNLCNTSKKVGRQHLNKTGLKTKEPPHSCTEQNVTTMGLRGQGIKLKPLDVPKECEKKSIQSSERKFLCRLNPTKIVNNGVNTTSKRLPSRIPVIQKSFFSKNEKNVSVITDSTLSAADRRQKFHQSRLHVAPPCSVTNSHIQLQHNKIAIYKDSTPGCYANCMPKVNVLPHTAHPKVVLPPIKNPIPAQDGGESTSQAKKKCLLGEITHFPALCNLTPKPIKKSNVSAVPHLPPILPPPAAPPPSISTSLEQESNKDKWLEKM